MEVVKFMYFVKPQIVIKESQSVPFAVLYGALEPLFVIEIDGGFSQDPWLRGDDWVSAFETGSQTT
jgi:hypothetical protein